jgi:hypothetical protein
MEFVLAGVRISAKDRMFSTMSRSRRLVTNCSSTLRSYPHSNGIANLLERASDRRTVPW